MRSVLSPKVVVYLLYLLKLKSFLHQFQMHPIAPTHAGRVCTTATFVVNLRESKTIFSYVERNGQKEGDEEACHQIFKREAR